MSINSNVVNNPTIVEYGKFVELQNDSRFPAVSVTRWTYGGSGAALSSVEAYPKFAVLSYLTNPEDIKVSLSAENINVNLTDIEKLVGRSNTLLESSTGYGLDIENLLIRSNTLFESATGLTNDVKVNTSYLPSISADILDVENLLIRSNTLLNANTGYALDIVTNTSDIEALIGITNTLLTANSSNTSYLIPKAYTSVTTTALTSKFFTNFAGVSGYLKNVKGINTAPDPSLPGTEVYLQIWTGDNNLTGINSKLIFTYSVESESNFDIVFPDGIIVYPLWIVGSLTSTTYTPAPDTLFLTITYTT